MSLVDGGTLRSADQGCSRARLKPVGRLVRLAPGLVLVTLLGGCPLGGGGGETPAPIKVEREGNRSITITSLSAQPITIQGILLNDRSGVYGCDFQVSMNGKGAILTANSPRFQGGGWSDDDIKDDIRQARIELDFQPKTLGGEGDTTTLDRSLDILNEYKCGAIVKVEVETDRGTYDFLFN